MLLLTLPTSASRMRYGGIHIPANDGASTMRTAATIDAIEKFGQLSILLQRPADDVEDVLRVRPRLHVAAALAAQQPLDFP